MLLLLPCCRLRGWAGRSAGPTWAPCVPWPHKEAPRKAAVMLPGWAWASPGPRPTPS